jgi:transposase
MSCLPALAGVCPHPTLVRRDTIILTESTLIVAGADTHTDTIHVAAISLTGAAIGDREFPTTRVGYVAAIRFLHSLGHVERIGVEGTASYGAGFTRALTAAGIAVVEVTRAVKSDPLDAYSAARTALAGDGLATPKDDATSGLRALPDRSPLGSQAPHRRDQPGQGHARVRTGRGA